MVRAGVANPRSQHGDHRAREEVTPVESQSTGIKCQQWWTMSRAVQVPLTRRMHSRGRQAPLPSPRRHQRPSTWATTMYTLPPLNHQNTTGTRSDKTRPDGDKTSNTWGHPGKGTALTPGHPFCLPPGRVADRTAPKAPATREEASRGVWLFVNDSFSLAHRSHVRKGKDTDKHAITLTHMAEDLPWQWLK